MISYSIQKNKNKPLAVPLVHIEDTSDYYERFELNGVLGYKTRLNVKYTLAVDISGLKEEEVIRFLRQTKGTQGTLTIRQGKSSWVFKNAYLESEREFTDEFILEVSNPHEIES